MNTTKTQFSCMPLAASRSFRLMVLSLLMIVSVMVSAAFSQRVVTVKIGETAPATGTFEFQVDRRNTSAVSTNPSIATAKYNDDRVRFDVEGHAVGETTIRLMVRSDLVRPPANPRDAPVQLGRSYAETVKVIVTDKQLSTLVRPIHSFTVSNDPPGSPLLSSIMGAEFSSPRDKGTKWRNLRIYGGDSSVATAELNNDPPLRLIIRGSQPGERTQITVVGERFYSEVWQQVVCTIKISVRGQKVPPARSADAMAAKLDDEIKSELDDLDSMSRSAKQKLLKELQKMSERTEWLIRDEEESEFEVTTNELREKRERIELLWKLWTDLLRASETIEESLANDADGKAPAEQNPAEPKAPRPAPPAGPAENFGEIRWTDTPDKLNLLDKVGKRFTVKCPARPVTERQGIFTIAGDGPFAGSSSICNAAIYSSLIGPGGGSVTVEISGPLASYKGTTNYEDAALYSKNGVQAFSLPGAMSELFPQPRCSFTFVR